MKKCFLLLVLLINIKLTAQTVVSVTDFGVSPNSSINTVPALKRAIDYCKGKTNVILSFPNGRYDFWAVSTKEISDNIGFNMIGLKDVIVEGNGSEFIFHGWMQIANVDSCENITFRDFSVDWDRPFISQAQIIQASNSFLDVKIDRKKYPYVIENGKILFLGEGWKLPVLNVYNNLYDRFKKEIVYNTWDNPLGNIFNQEAEELSTGIVRFHGEVPIKPDSGTYVSLFHVRYAINGFHLQNSRNITLKDLQIFHCLSHGVLGERTENITMNNASVMVNDCKGRVFSGVADASHFVNCKGIIKVENCAHTGQGDDFINVHGRNVMIQKIIDKKTIEVKLDGRYNTEGDEVWFIDQETAQRGELRKIESISPVFNEQNKLSGYRLTFTQTLPSIVEENDFIENKTWAASLELRNCKILKRHRARGILVTTPEDVVIENNYFRSAGTAILIEGDLDFWFESGANNNVQIRNNVFEDCLTSGNAHASRGEWGEAVITITPSHKPKTLEDCPYHKNIFIYNNVFKVFDTPLIRARSVGNLGFTDNVIEKTDTYKPYAWQKSTFLFDGCRKVEISNNRWDKKYEMREIYIEHMKKSDIKLLNENTIKINKLLNINTYHEW